MLDDFLYRGGDRLAARIFGTDAILYGSPATWSDLVRRPREERPAASLAAAMFCLAAMFPTFFVLASTLGRSAELSIERQSVVRAMITAAIFGGIPIALALVGRVNWASGLGIRKAGLLSYVAAAILGHFALAGGARVALACQGFAINPELLKKINELVAQFQTMPLWLVLVAFAMVPAVFEELCFRGFLFGAIRERLSGPWTVVASPRSCLDSFMKSRFPESSCRRRRSASRSAGCDCGPAASCQAS